MADETRPIRRFIRRETVPTAEETGAHRVQADRGEDGKAAANISAARRSANSAWKRLQRLTTRTTARWASSWPRAARLCRGG